jgi:photosystem I P700 chlorophyll a apoprotein A1
MDSKYTLLSSRLTAPNALSATSLTWGGDIVAVGGVMMPISLGTSDFLVHHIHAFTIHVTVLILLKGVLFARSSRLIPDKANLGFRFPCALAVVVLSNFSLGPYFRSFWMYNSLSIVIFHFSWKMAICNDAGVSHITGGNFAQSANTINGWLRDFLWAQSSRYSIMVQHYLRMV